MTAIMALPIVVALAVLCIGWGGFVLVQLNRAAYYRALADAEPNIRARVDYRRRARAIARTI